MNSPRRLKLFLFLVGFVAVERFCHKQTGGFQVHKIYSSGISLPSQEIETPKCNIEEMWYQPFNFLKSEGETYVFLSQDQQFSIRFFKQHHLNPPVWLKWLHRTRSLQQLYESYQIAFEHLQKETGILYLHLHPTKTLQRHLKLIDNLGILHLVDADALEYVIQRQATPTFDHLDALLKNGQHEDAQRCVNSLLQLLVKRACMQIADQDPQIKKNFGFINHQAVEIDPSGYKRVPKEPLQSISERVLFCDVYQLKKWLARRSPELLEYMNAQLYATFSPP